MRYYSGRPRRFGLYLCEECGREFEHCKSNVARTKSCGCERDRKPVKHGDSTKKVPSPFRKLNQVWRDIKQRCFNPNSSRYSRYGGRGISMSSEWFDYIVFRDWALSNGYKEGLIIDRIDNNGNYEPGNCRWVDIKTSLLNRDLTNVGSKSRKIDRNKAGEIRESSDPADVLAGRYGVSTSLIYMVRSHRRWKDGSYR